MKTLVYTTLAATLGILVGIGNADAGSNPCKRHGPGFYVGVDNMCHPPSSRVARATPAQISKFAAHKAGFTTDRRSYDTRSGPTKQPVNPKRAEQQRLCDEQAAKRRTRGVKTSRVVWITSTHCRATGGMIETGKL